MKTKDNKYLKGYWFICERAKNRVKPEGYTEKHHIYPKSIYGQNKDLIHLTAKEHFLVHYMLWKGLRAKYGTKNINTRKMGNAFNCMKRKSKGQERFITAIKYQELKIANSEARKGLPSWNKGLTKGTDERLCFENPTKFKKGCVPWNKELIGYYSTEQLKIRSENTKNYQALYGNPMQGKKHSIEAKEKIKEAHLGKKDSAETKKKKSLANIGSNNPIYGKGGYYAIWIEKYGVEEADRMRIIRNLKEKETKRKNRELKKSIENE